MVCVLEKYCNLSQADYHRGVGRNLKIKETKKKKESQQLNLRV